MEVLLISHDGIASGAKRSVELILGEQERLSVIELTAAEGIGVFGTKLADFISRKIKETQQFLIISDLQNGSPYNAAAAYIIQNNLANKVTLLTGMNLNMVLESVLFDGDELTHDGIGQILGISVEGISMLQMQEHLTLISTGDE